MKSQISGSKLLLAILKKDLKVYSRNTIYLFLTIISLVFFVAIFWIVPDTVEEDITFAITPPLSELFSEGRDVLLAAGIPEQLLEQFDDLEAAFEEEGLMLVEFENEDQLKKAITQDLEVYKTEQGRFVIHDPDGEQKKPENSKRIRLDIGMSFPPTFFGDVVVGVRPTVTVFADAAVPDEIRGAMQGFIREMAYQLAGHELPVELPDEEMIILGQDRLGAQISTRTKMRPLIAFFILMMETFALASLISNEVLQRTVTALLVTPMRVWHFLTAKTIFGMALAMSQGLIVLIFVRAFTAENWPLLLLTIFLGSLLFTAVAMLVGAAGKDFIGQLMFSMLFIIPLMIPSFAVLFPGSVATWVRALPSYPIVNLLYEVTIHGATWADSYTSLLYAALWVLIIFAAGLFVLKRKVATL
ncbi:MAG: ABC transporter permease [Bacillota bacterium]|nr:ABC transporter permease [Bacillota bacterium]